MPLQGACLRVLFALWMLVPLQCAAAVCRCKALLSECCLRLGVWLHVPLLCWCLHGATARCHCRMLLSGCRCQSVVRTFEFGCWCCGVLLRGAAAGCCCRVLLQGAAVSALGLGCWCRSLLGTAAGYRCRVPLCYKVPPSECSLRFGAWLLVPLQGAAAGQRLQGAARYCCRMFAGCLCWRCLRFGAWLCRAPLQGVPLQGAAARCCCQSAAFGLGCWCHCWAPLQGAAAKVLLPRCFLHFGAQF